MRHKGKRICPPAIEPGILAADLIDNHFLAYNSSRLREACLLYLELLREKSLIGMSIAGALTPAGLGMSALVPMIQAGYVDYIISTGANLYHDMHFALDKELIASTPFQDDPELRKQKIVRIYDIVMELKTLLDTDAFVYGIISQPEFRKPMGTAEFHYRIGKYVHKTEEELGIGTRSILSAAYQAKVPIYTSSPGDSTLGMNAAALSFLGHELILDPSRDVNETTSILYWAKRAGMLSGVVMLGGGSPKNFMLQTEPQLQEILGFEEEGHNIFIQITDARPDTGGLSGATPHEAVTWGKLVIDIELHSSVVYTDSTLALPLIAAYILTRGPKRESLRLYERREEMYRTLAREYRRKKGIIDEEIASGE